MHKIGNLLFWEVQKTKLQDQEGEIIGMQECWLTCHLERELGKLLKTDSLCTAAPILLGCVCPELKQGSFQASVFALQTCLPICSPAVHYCLHSGINVPTPACQQSDSFKLLCLLSRGWDQLFFCPAAQHTATQSLSYSHTVLLTHTHAPAVCLLTALGEARFASAVWLACV